MKISLKPYQQFPADIHYDMYETPVVFLSWSFPSPWDGDGLPAVKYSSKDNLMVVVIEEGG